MFNIQNFAPYLSDKLVMSYSSCDRCAPGQAHPRLILRPNDPRFVCIYNGSSRCSSLNKLIELQPSIARGSTNLSPLLPQRLGSQSQLPKQSVMLGSISQPVPPHQLTLSQQSLAPQPVRPRRPVLSLLHPVPISATSEPDVSPKLYSRHNSYSYSGSSDRSELRTSVPTAYSAVIHVTC